MLLDRIAHMHTAEDLDSRCTGLNGSIANLHTVERDRDNSEPQRVTKRKRERERERERERDGYNFDAFR
jgi:hypothetical protein